MSRHKHKSKPRSRTRSHACHPHRRPLRFEPLEDRRLLSITVNTLVDENDGIDVGGISLRDAIAVAVPGDTINFAPPLTASGPATILLTHGELAITKSLTINGPGANLLTIDASGNDPTPYNAPLPAAEYFSDGSRVFRIDDGNAAEKVVSLSGLKIVGGDVPGDGGGILNYEQLALVNCEISHNIADGSGGGIANRGDATVTNCTLANNDSRTNGGGASNTLNLTIQSTELLDNRIVNSYFVVLTDGRGGGLFTSGTLSISRSTISGNASISGGGVAVTSAGNVSISQSTVSNNYASNGGGILTEPGASVHVTSSTVNNNQAITSGGGFFVKYASLTLISCTITGNDAEQSGGAAYVAASAAAPAEIDFCTIAENHANDNASGGGIFLASGTLRLSSTIVARNMADNGPDLTGIIGAAFDANYCLIGDGTKSSLPEAPVGSPDAKGNLVGGQVHGLIDPGLSSLADHGGPTWTMLLLPESPALEVGNPTAVAGAGMVPQFDQRGAPFSRVAGGHIDIGATERQTAPNLNLIVDTLADESDGNYAAGDLSLREAIGLANGSVGPNTISFAPSLYGGGPATISLTLGILMLDESATILSPNANLLTLDGSNNKRSRNEVRDITKGAEAFEIVQYYALAPVQVEIGRLTITKFGAQNFDYEAAIYNSAQLTITGCNITNNFNIGVRNVASLGIASTTINNNMGQGLINDGQCTITSSTISGNTTGIINNSGSLTITDSTISGNQAKYNGGGIYTATNFTATNVTISGNSSAQNGGGIFVGNNAGYSPNISLNFCTISRNYAALGGGMFLALGTASLNNSIVADNSYGIAGDLAGLIGTAITPKFCLIGSNSGSGLTEAPVGAPDANGNLIGGMIHGFIYPYLGQLGNNGGKTQTLALLAGSAAIDAGDPAATAGVNNVPQFDQRGEAFGRVYGGRIDVGTFEYRPTLPGDYNFDGIVDAADYSVWRDTLGSTTDLRADASGPTVGTPNGIVDQADYTFWKSHFGNTLPAAGSAATTSAPSVAAVMAPASPNPQSTLASKSSLLAPESFPLTSNPQSAIENPKFTTLAPRRVPSVWFLVPPSTLDSALLTWLATQTNQPSDQPAIALSKPAKSDNVDPHTDLDALDTAFATIATSP